MKYIKPISKTLFIPLTIILLLGFLPESFSETELKTVAIFVQPPNGLTTNEDGTSDKNKPISQNPPNSPNELPNAFVTGNEYAINSSAIYINTDEGLSLNNLLILVSDKSMLLGCSRSSLFKTF